ncbi:MAG: hypothetical protein IJL70_05375 [Treponema sp.]|nr:hypothetical protein [Treponema sp.]
MKICKNCGYKNLQSSNFCTQCGSFLDNDYEEKLGTYKNVIIEGVATETVQRHGSAVKQQVVAYSGIDNETGEQIKKGLKQISESNVNPEYTKQNLKQQAGFSAENKYTARENAKRIISKSGERVHNTDIKGSGSYNELFDYIITDENGDVISEEQMKFVGNNPKELVNKLASKKFQKYLDADAKITIPKDYYEGIEIDGKKVSVFTEIDKSLKSYHKQLERAKATGNAEVAKNLEEKIAKYEKIRTSLKNSGISNAEAMEARLHPVLSTTKDIGKISVRAGGIQAGYGAAIGGCISIVRNTVAVIKGEKTLSEAAKSVGGDTIKSGAVGFATGFTGSAIKGILQNSGKAAIRQLSKTNFASTLATSTVEVGKTLTKYMQGEISGVKCLEELGEKGTGQIGASVFAIVGQAAIPIPVVGALMGSIVGYTLCSACYKETLRVLKEPYLSYKERIRVEKECNEIISLMRQYRQEMNKQINCYLSDYLETFDNAFEQMYKALELNNIDGFINGANLITTKLHGKVQFNSFNG